MAQAHSYRKSHSETRKHPSTREHHSTKGQWREASTPMRENSRQSGLVQLIERDAPLQTHSSLVLMYGPFQAELQPEPSRGVASWLKQCIREHGLPSLVRFDYRRRAQIFRRDQFQPWLEPLISDIQAS